MNRSLVLPILSNARTLGRGLTRREILQQILAGLGVALAGPMASAHPMGKYAGDPSCLATAAEKIVGDDWEPEFLNLQQNETVIAVAEAIVAGSTQALVNRVVDRLLTVEPAENQKKFVAALDALEAESQKRFTSRISGLNARRMSELLSACSKDSDGSSAARKESELDSRATLHEHFETLKGWFVATYYSSEQGMRELGWTDEFYFDGPPECPHPEEHR